MLIEVTHVVNGSTQKHVFTCTDASRQIDPGNIILMDGPGYDHSGRKVLSAQYWTAEKIITYDEGDIAPDATKAAS